MITLPLLVYLAANSGGFSPRGASLFVVEVPDTDELTYRRVIRIAESAKCHCTFGKSSFAFDIVTSSGDAGKLVIAISKELSGMHRIGILRTNVLAIFRPSAVLNAERARAYN